MEQKATVSFETQYNDARGKPLPQPSTTLIIQGELLPDSPLVHHMVAALLDRKNPPKVVVRYKNVGNKITYSVGFSHTKNVVAEGAAEHALATRAANMIPPMTVEDLRAREAQLEAAQKELAAEKE